MGFIGKFFGSIFLFLGTAMLFIMLYRLNSKSGAYIGLSDIYFYFKNTPFDVFGSYNQMIEHVNKTLDNFVKSFIDFSPFTSVFDDGFEWYEIFTLVFEGFKYLFNITLNLSKMVFLPLTTLYYVIQYVIGIVVYMFSFLTFLLRF